MIRFGPEICGDLDQALRREWLETNGLGGFASSTIIGLNTRRYHGLLTAALDPPGERKMLLSKLEETLVIDGRRYELSTNQYPGVIHPQGYKLQSAFRLDPFPVFTWLVEDVELHKTVFLIHGENGVVVQYLLRSSHHGCALELRPLVGFRDYHSTAHANAPLDWGGLQIAHDAETVETSSHWYFNFEYERERERGLDYREDLFQPYVLKFDLSHRTQATVIASTEPHTADQAAGLRLAEVNRRKSLRPFAADQFIVRRGAGKSVIAGYPWFGDWGRDTMVSLPGLTLATGRSEITREILAEYGRHIRDGLLPNNFPAEYNTVDASLWYLEAIRAYIAATGDSKFVLENLWDAMTSIIDRYARGTRYGIQMEADGLIHAGEPGVQLTWMDAKVGDWVVTPRHGKPVEVQALWYNALCLMAALREENPYREMAERAKSSFAALFWNESAGCLYDVVGEAGPDASIRPNQIAALALHYPILDDRAKALRVLEVVERELLTPFGLRTLAPSDPQYRGRYEGDMRSRDGAYHQGTVWPWLMGMFVTAALRYGHASLVQARAWLEPLRRFSENEGVGQIPEIFDGDPPHEPRGCIAQAWSVAELLRAQALVQE